MTRHCHYCGALDTLVCEIEPATAGVARFGAQARCHGCGLAGPRALAMTLGLAQAEAWLLWDGLPARLAVTSGPGQAPEPTPDALHAAMVSRGLTIRRHGDGWAANLPTGEAIHATHAATPDGAMRAAYDYFQSRF